MDYLILDTSSQNFCDCCGKKNLKLTIALQVLAEGRPICVQNYGVVCAKAAASHPKDPRLMRRHDGSMAFSKESIVEVAKQCGRIRTGR